jgi:hypothetical protein
VRAPKLSMDWPSLFQEKPQGVHVRPLGLSPPKLLLIQRTLHITTTDSSAVGRWSGAWEPTAADAVFASGRKAHPVSPDCADHIIALGLRFREVNSPSGCAEEGKTSWEGACLSNLASGDG